MSLVALAVICVIGNIITVADKMSELSPWLGYAFYGVMLALTTAFIVWPTVKIVFTPELESSGELMAQDVFTCLSMNVSLINRLVDLRGKRPSFGQILRLYWSVASSSVLIASADEALDDINLGELLGLSGINATDVLLKSMTNGVLNALVTMRIGMTALRYLEVGSIEFNHNKSSICKDVRRKAMMRMPAVVASGIKNGILGIKNIF